MSLLKQTNLAKKILINLLFEYNVAFLVEIYDVLNLSKISEV